MESGGDVTQGPDHQDGDFWPDHATQFPKVEREIHAAVWSFLAQVLVTPVTGPSTPPAPSPAATPNPGPCLVATTLYRDPEHPSVVFLRDVRDRQLPASGAGRRFAAWLVAGYDRVSPAMARWFTRHPATARAIRRIVFVPLVRTLRTVSTLTARSPRTRSLALSAALGAIAAPVITLASATRRMPLRRRRCSTGSAVVRRR